MSVSLVITNGLDIAEIVKCFDGKKAQGYDMMPMKLL